MSSMKNQLFMPFRKCDLVDAYLVSLTQANNFSLWTLIQGVLLGLSNTAGVLAGVFGTAATGYILQHGKLSLLASFS